MNEIIQSSVYTTQKGTPVTDSVKVARVFDKIKPHYDGKVTSIVAGNVLQFVDSGFPFDLMAKNGDETIYLVPGENAKIHFNTGNLAGYEFEVTNYEHSTRKFTLKKFQDDRGDVFPNDSSTAFQFGQKRIVRNY